MKKEKYGALNFVVTEDGIETITTGQAIRKFRKELYEKAKANLGIIKDSIRFILVSELERVAGEDFGNYIKKNFDGRIHKNEINGVNNLISLVKTVATKRGVTEPCIAYIDVGGKRLLVSDKYDVLFLNAEVKTGRDFDFNPYSDKGNTIFGWDHPSITECYHKDLEEYECDYRLEYKMRLGTSCCCNAMDHSFDEEACRECDFYEEVANSEIEGREVIYIKAV